ncbi:MAG: aromatic ring-hydroxylating dioxygenase subunit alpha [Sphingomonadaceae bacterium]
MADSNASLETRLEKSLPSSAYVAPEAWQAERSAIFLKEWFCAAREEDLPEPGSHLTLDILGESVILVRTKRGELKAHYNVCRHRGSRLCDHANDAKWGLELPGGMIGGVIRCPYHGWAYGLDGDLLAAPGAGNGIGKAEFHLFPVGVMTWGGFVFLNLTPEGAPGIAEALHGAPRRLANYPLEDLRTGPIHTYDVAANWKLILENYNECYHCGQVHPELCEVVPEFRKDGGIHLDWELGIPHREGATTYTASGTTKRDFMPGLSEEEKVRHKGELIYPNLMFSVSSDHAAAFILWPLGVNRTRIECRFLFHKDEMAKPDFDHSDASEFWDLVNRQDWAVCERVQRGISANVHEHGWYLPIEDYSLDIRRYIADRLP